MSKTAVRLPAVLGLLALGLAGFGGVLLAEEATTLTGEYVWSHRGATGDLEAVFTPTEQGQWDVAFRFTFRGKPRTYIGTAQGSLSEGALKGEVRNETKERTFTFTGQFEDGAFRGTHAEVEDGKAHDTGTLTLNR